jgi:hypothetical protein
VAAEEGLAVAVAVLQLQGFMKALAAGILGAAMSCIGGIVAESLNRMETGSSSRTMKQQQQEVCRFGAAAAVCLLVGAVVGVAGESDPLSLHLVGAAAVLML